MIAEPLILAAAGILLFILGLLIGMALERSAVKNARREDLIE
ncbi:hypothetical protein HHTV1_59 [Haloarcula hispanica tailed virus 1]|uniref:Uncharacterized protein n=1 Tax=Haloarcula hispanica tailed virus 1 TaxID=1273750 RepID=R4TMB6_9CAUD|nr:hypothetical protein M198_gp59 [Haloarcula hispanica tailed virus 1]AGM11313.1 hypothetical protein HHTV1_59 [Haloarcula hispanica tailed virus 1]